MWGKRKATGPSHADTEVAGQKWRERVGVRLDPCGRGGRSVTLLDREKEWGAHNFPDHEHNASDISQLKHNTPVSDTHLHQHLPLHLTKNDGEATDTSIDDRVPKETGNNIPEIIGTNLAWN